jgi:hypothetical protein
MHDKLSFRNVKQKPSGEWGVTSADNPLHYEFLNDPDMNQRMTRIKKELYRTKSKLKRKKSDRMIIIIFLLTTASIISLLMINQENAWSLISFSATSIYVLISWVLFQRILRPTTSDIKYLRIKAGFLASKKKETSHWLKTPKSNVNPSPENMDPSMGSKSAPQQ